jgi:hypothetical protein
METVVATLIAVVLAVGLVALDQEGTQVLLSGRTEAHVLVRVRTAALSVPGMRTADHVVGV